MADSRKTELSPRQQALFERLLRDKGLHPGPGERIAGYTGNEPVRLTHQQEGLWFLEQIQPERCLYNVPCCLRIRGNLDTDALERSLSAIVDRHDALRTCFPLYRDVPVLKVSPPGTLRVARINYSSLPIAEAEQQAIFVASEQCRTPFKLAEGPVVRATLIKLATRDHVLVFVTHHLVTDGWSMGIFLRELVAHYEAFSRGTEPLLQQPGITFLDYAAWYRGWLTGDNLESLLSFWRRRLEGFEELVLPAGGGAAGSAETGAHADVSLSAAATSGVREFAKKAGVTRFIVLLAACRCMFYSYSRQEDQIIGSPLAMRNQPELEPLVGYFINALPFRTDLGGDPAFRELVQREQITAEGVYEHQDMPFAKLVQALKLSRPDGVNPVYQTQFSLLDPKHSPDVLGFGLNLDPDERLRFGDAQMSPLPIDNAVSKFHIGFLLWDRPDRITGTCEYNPQLFNPEAIDGIVRRFTDIVDLVVADPDIKLSQLTERFAAPASAVMRETGSTGSGKASPASPSDGRQTKSKPEVRPVQELLRGRPLPITRTTVIDDILRQVSQNGGETAVVCGASRLSYGQLGARAGAIAATLKDLGVARGNVVVCGERSAGFVAAILGVGSAGFTYVPVDSGYPEERIRFILEDAEAVCMLRDASCTVRAGDGLPVLCFDREGVLADAAASPAAPLESCAKPPDAAYLIYTSGSTGKPKGVVISHANLMLSTAARSVEYGHRPDVYLMPSSFAFDSSVAGIYWTLTTGGTLVIPAPAEAADAQAMGRLVAEHRVTHTLMLPSLYDAVLKTTAPTNLQSLHTVIVAGEECPPDIPARHFAALPDTDLFNEYGPTEATVWCTLYRVSAGDGGGRLPIGQPIAGTTLHILEASMNPVPVGSAGELYVESASVAAGYWRRDDLTAERFLPRLDAAGNGLRMYRTGDLVRVNAGGQIEFLGRVDRQVKIRGHRIELEEIENAMRRIPGVSSAAVTVRDSGRAKELAGYYTSDDGSVDGKGLVAALRDSLPAHFVPKAIVQLAAMPLMPNGKIDLQALPAVAVVTGDDGEYEEPRDAAEKTLQKIFEATLEQDRVGIRESFFEIGGHSILATIAVARMREEFGIPIPMRTLFDHPTIAALNEALFGSIDTSAEAAAEVREEPQPQPAIPARADRTRGRLSPMQSALWYLCQLDTSRGAYNLQCGFRLVGYLDIGRLKEAIETVVNSHTVLRSDIAVDGDGQPFARIHERVEVPFEYTELRQVGQNRREFLDSVAVEPVPTDRAPLLRISLARCSGDEYLLVFVFHHIVVEGWSVATVLREIEHAYADLAAGNRPALPTEPIDYWDWNEHEARRLSEEALAPQLAYWKARLAGRRPVLELTHRRRSGPAKGGMIGARLSTVLVKRLEHVAKERGASLFMLLLGAYQVLLHRYTGETDIRVGVPINTRTRSELDRTAGLFINTLVMRAETKPSVKFEDFLGAVKNDVLDAFSNMDAPLESVARSVIATSDRTNRDLFQAMFALQNAPGMSLVLPGAESTMLEHDELHSGAGKVDLSLVIEPGADGYRVWMEFDGHALDGERAKRFLRHFDRLLVSIADHPGEELGRLTILPDDERKTLLESFNATTQSYDERVAVRRVWDQIDTRADGVAVVNGSASLTYRELGVNAARVVHSILAAGCPAGAVIAVCMRRRPQLVETLVGIHLAGCCYVPLDPEYPDERIEYIVNDSGAVLLITDDPPRFCVLDLDAAVLDASAARDSSPADSGSFRWPTVDDLAYIVYTSGSTGVPKGVRIANRGLSNLVAWEERTYGTTSRDRMTMLAGLGFDATVWEVWPCLAVGAELHLIDDEIRANPAAVYDWLSSSRITVTFLPTPLAELVLDLPTPAGISLRYLFTGGDALHARQWPDLPFPVVNHYGPSESTVVATAGIVNKDLPPDLPPDIGKPIDNTRAYILDEAMQPVPVGVVGELCLAGPAVSCGYVDENERSADRFVTNPFADGAWARMYRTGDRACFNSDGTIEFLGRIDQQVKIRGFRIELGEIESALTRHPAVSKAAVAVWKVNRDDQRISAYIVRAPGHADFDAIALRKFVSKRLPSYMVPTYFSPLDALPLTANGKVDRKSLPPPVTERALRSQEPPGTATEVTIAEIWQRIVGADSMDRNANFFEVGGNSISAMKVVSEIYSTLGIQVPLGAIAMDSLWQIAAWCDEKSPAASPTRRESRLRKLLTIVLGGNA